jgi:hypothetical protein
MDGQEEIAHSQCSTLLGNDYQRVDILLDQLYPLDDVNSIPQLVQETQNYINGTDPNSAPKWADVINWVKANL